MRATFMNSGSALSIGIFFTFMIVGLAGTLPSALSSGLRGQGVPGAVADQVAGLPPVGSLFAAFLGVNPIQQLLEPSGVLNHLPAANVATLTGTQFFPQLISGPFQHGLFAAFLAALVMTVVGAVASALQGRSVTLARPTAAAAPGPDAMAIPVAAGPRPEHLGEFVHDFERDMRAEHERHRDERQQDGRDPEYRPSPGDASEGGAVVAGSAYPGEPESSSACSGAPGAGGETAIGSADIGASRSGASDTGAPDIVASDLGASDATASGTDDAQLKDRLLDVLLTDPGRVLRAARALESSQGRLVELRRSVDAARGQVVDAARTLREAGRNRAQVARLSGGNQRELLELLGDVPRPSSTARPNPATRWAGPHAG
jgi:hypothetical protein